MKIQQVVLVRMFALLALPCINAQFSTGFAQGTTITYQGRLNDGGIPANGTYDLHFTVLDAGTNGDVLSDAVTGPPVAVTNGLFTVPINFGDNVFTGPDRWLAIGVRTNGSTGPYAILSPRQQLTPAPYAITAGNVTGSFSASQLTGTVPSSALAGAYSGTVTFVNPNNIFAGNGTGLTNLDAWQLSGNAGTTAGVNFLGTVDNQPVEIHVNGQRAFRLEPNASGVNVIGGDANNTVTPGAFAATIGGGQFNQIQAPAVRSTVGGGYNNQIQSNASYSTVGGGFRNVVSGMGSFIGGGGTDGSFFQGNTNAGNAAVIGGGLNNQIQPLADYSVIGGGDLNQIQSYALDSTIGGGTFNQIQFNAGHSTIGGGAYNVVDSPLATIGGGQADQIYADTSTISGGFDNVIWPFAFSSVIGGGSVNQIQPDAYYSVIGGGEQNQIEPNTPYSVIGGGRQNSATGVGSFIGGGGFDGSIIAGNNNGGNAAVIGGGWGNLIQTNSPYTAIGGGSGNAIQSSAGNSTISGGYNNQVSPNSRYSSIGGGFQNVVAGFGAVIGGGGTDGASFAGSTNAGNAAVIGGGLNNQILLGSDYSAIGGGNGNVASGAMATIPGGDQNAATNNSFAAGHRAKAYDQGAFVWADSTDADFSDTGSNTFNVRVSGGVTFASGSGGANQTVSWTPGSGAWSFTSDRNAKENFKPVDARKILEKVAQLPLTEWNYKGYGDRHVGPMAQDFHAAFPFNPNDKMLNSADEAGITLAAVQGLNEKLDEKDAEIQHLKQQNDSLTERMNELEATVKQLAVQK